MSAPVAGGQARKYSLPEAAQRRQVEAALRAQEGWTERPEQSCAYRLDFASGGERVVVKQYTNGTLLLTGSGASRSPPGSSHHDGQQRRGDAGGGGEARLRNRGQLDEPGPAGVEQRGGRRPPLRCPLDRERRVREGGLLRPSGGLRRLRRRAHPGDPGDAGGAGQQTPLGRPEPAPGGGGAGRLRPGVRRGAGAPGALQRPLRAVPAGGEEPQHPAGVGARAGAAGGA